MSFDLTCFAQPPASLRGAPFWSLNNDLTDHDRLREQIDAFAAMGMGGYHLHVRNGLKTPYMSEDFLDAIRAAREHGAAQGLLSYLYDEDTWPSGFAGGEATRELRYRQRWVDIEQQRPQESAFISVLAAYRVTLDGEGFLSSFTRLDPATTEAGCWYVIRHIAPDNDRFNGAAYLDTMNPAAVDHFIACTHERYLAAFGGSFPADVPAIFTDEPEFHGNHALVVPQSGSARLPWTDDLPDSFSALYGADLLGLLPELIWPRAGGPSPWRWRFWDHATERFASAFADRVGGWCEEHGIKLTGHMLSEESLQSQMCGLGEAMRHYRGFQIPGIDMLCDGYEPSTAKQAVSVSRQDGRNAVMSELYGVTNWDFPFSGHKRQGDWQAALGVTLRVHHLTWLSMEGDAKRDYPASIGMHSPWWREYRLVEDHFARVNAALTSGTPLVRVGVIHPIESCWMTRGVRSLEEHRFADLETGFKDCISWLLDGQIDFDFVAESLLPRQERMTDTAVLQVGAMGYDVIVLPQLLTIRSSTLDSLERFQARGGRVVVLGQLPVRCDGAPSERPAAVLSAATLVSRSPASLLEALASWREVEVRTHMGMRRANLNHQLRRIGEERLLFVCNRADAIRPMPWDNFNGEDLIRLRGHWVVSELDTTRGEERACAYRQVGDWTEVPWRILPESHRLLHLRPGAGACEFVQAGYRICADLPAPQAVIRNAANALLLDRAAWQVEDEPWQPPQDCQQTTLQLIRRFGWPDWGQPYSVVDAGPWRRVTRRFRFRSDAAVSGARLVCERLAAATIQLDGQPVANRAEGWWVDQDLPTCALPELSAGWHELEITLPLNAVSRQLENCFIIGDFAVRVAGDQAWVEAEDANRTWGDAAGQGLAFYGDDLDYCCALNIEAAGRYVLRCPRFANPVLRVHVDGRDCGPIAFAPYRVELGELSVGSHTISIRAYGSRINSFGALHNCAYGWRWWGPDAYRTSGEEWNDVYQLRPVGLLRAPILERIEG